MRNKKRQGRLINILMKDGSPRRIPREQAEELLSRGKAKRYISNTVYKALSLGIEVKNHGTLDKDGKLKKKVQSALNKRTKSKSNEDEEEKA